MSLKTLYTNSLGIATTDLPDGAYSYQITKTGYDAQEGTFTVAGANLAIPVELVAIVPTDPLIVPYEVPTVKTEANYANVVYFDYQSGNNANAGTEAAPFKDFNTKYSTGIPANTAFLFKRGSEHPRIGKPETQKAWTIYEDMLYDNNFIGAYGTGARPIIRGMWIHPPSTHLTVRDISIQSISWAPVQHDGPLTIWSYGTNPWYKGNTVRSSNITIAFNEIWGVETPDETYRQPYDDYDDAPFRYPRGLLYFDGDDITIYNNHLKNSWTSGIGSWYNGANKWIVRNYLEKLSWCGPFNEDIWSQYFLPSPQPAQGNGIAISRGLGNNHRVNGNLVDRSNSFGKTCMVWAQVHQGWGSGNTGWEMKYNTLHGPDEGSTSPLFHFSPPEGTEIEHNVFDSSGKGQWAAGKVPFWGTWPDAWYAQQFGQDPVKIKDNHIIRVGNLFGNDTAGDATVLTDNTRYTTYAAFLTAKAASATLIGSDIDPDNFWGDYSEIETEDFYKVATVKSRITATTEPQTAAYTALLADAVAAQLFVSAAPATHDVDRHNLGPTRDLFEDEAEAAYCSALAWLYGDDTDHADKAVEILNAWSTADTTFTTDGDPIDSSWQEAELQLSSWFARILYAVYILNHHEYAGWTTANHAAFEAWWRAKVLAWIQMSMTRSNNWGDSGLFAVALTGMTFNDQDLIDSCVNRIDTFYLVNNTKIAKDTDGEYLPEEVTRNSGDSGILYTAYSLNMLVQALEILKCCGQNRWYQSHVSGATFKGLIDYYFRWNELGDPFPWSATAAVTTRRRNPFEHANNYFSGQITGLATWLGTNRPVDGRQGDKYITLNRGDL